MRQTMKTAAMLLAAMCAGYLGGLLSQVNRPASAQAGNNVVTAKKFVLVDNAGKTRGEFFVKDGDPGLRLLDGAGKSRCELSLVEDDPSLELSDENGKPRGEFFLIGGSPMLGLSDEKGKLRASFAMILGEPYINLADAAGKVTWKAPDKGK